MKNTKLSSKDFHKCDVCNGKLHGFLCCVTGTFDEDTGKGKCKKCDEIATTATNKTRSSTRKKTPPPPPSPPPQRRPTRQSSRK